MILVFWPSLELYSVVGISNEKGHEIDGDEDENASGDGGEKANENDVENANANVNADDANADDAENANANVNDGVPVNVNHGGNSRGCGRVDPGYRIFFPAGLCSGLLWPQSTGVSHPFQSSSNTETHRFFVFRSRLSRKCTYATPILVHC